MWQRLFPHRGLYLGDLFDRAARQHPDTTVVLDRAFDVGAPDRLEHTYRDLAGLVDDLACRLWAAGVRPTEHVAVHKTDNVDIALLACAVARIGAVPALLSPTLDAVVVAGLLARLGRPWLVTDAARLGGGLADTGVEHLTRQVLTVGPAPEPTTAATTVPVTVLTDLAPAPRPASVHLAPDEPALVTHSSGTTGVPKLAVHCPRTMWHRLVPQAVLGLPTRGETAALHMSFVHSRFYHLLAVLLRNGSPLVLLVDPDPTHVGRVLARHRPGIVETHPNTYVLWEELADAPDAPLAGVRSFGSTFDAIHPRTVQRLLGASRRRAPYLVQLYGQSETGPVAAWAYTLRSAGRGNGRLVGAALPGFTRLRTVDAEGRVCPVGVPGHIEARTHGRCLTYLGEEELYARQVDRGWWRMGDVGRLDRGRRLHLVDREIDRIADVDSNLEIEDELLSRLPELREIVVVAGAGGEPVPVVCTDRDAPLRPERWRRATADLPALADPVQWRFADVPRTGTWKVRRVEVTRMLTAGAQPAARPGVARATLPAAGA